jgi:hypothetical protein
MYQIRKAYSTAGKLPMIMYPATQPKTLHFMVLSNRLHKLFDRLLESINSVDAILAQ